ncbi:MAG: FHA domain-containing protein [Deltaproteobacteria bacterium]|nr:FHA domain-containing protein [Deltaproteobacteria bacterium]
MGFALKIIAGKGAGRVFKFSQKAVKVGRLPDNDLVLYDMGVSRYHCEIVQDGATFTLRDTGSANGTLLNDVVTTEAQLQPGDRIGIGPVTFALEREAVAVAADDSGSHQPVEAFPRDSDFGGDDSVDDKTRSRRKLPAKDIALLFGKPAPDPHRTATGSYVAHSRKLWQRLPASTRRATVVALVLVLVGAAVSLQMIKNRPRQDRSAEIFAADKANAALSFGAGKVDVFTPDRVNFQIDFKGGRVLLHFAAGGVESPTELEMLLNGKPIGFVEMTPERWTTGMKVTLPRALLKRGTNILTFDNTATPRRDERWGVAQVHIEETPLPPPDEAKAKELFELGRASYEARSVAPINLTRAIQYFDDAERYLEGMPQPPSLYVTIRDAEANARQELQNVFDSYIFTVEKALRFSDTEGAVETLRELLRYFSDPEDPRYVKAKSRLNEILGGKQP